LIDDDYGTGLVG